MLLIIFVGPQGSGKTTQARILSHLLSQRNWRVGCTELITYATLSVVFRRVLALLPVSRSYERFYEDRPPIPAIRNPDLVRRLQPLLFSLHTLGLAISMVKLSLLSRRKQVIIEHEGFIFKQLVDLLYDMSKMGVAGRESHDDIGLTCLGKLFIGALSCGGTELAIVQLSVPYEELKIRYQHKGRPIEPLDYITFQNKTYPKLIEWAKKTLDNKKRFRVLMCDQAGILGLSDRVVAGVKK